MRFCLIGFALAILGMRPDVSAAGPEPTVVERFEKTVRPVLAARCWRCHGPEQHKGGLRLDSADGVGTGGDSGPIVVAGKPEESRLIQAVRYAGDLKMPPKGRLSDAEAAELTEWVRTGAVWPESRTASRTDSPASRTTEGPAAFWAFQVPRDPSPPEVKAVDWPRSPLDRFILAALERKRLAPASPAGKRTLIRRATFDLTGLPPTPEEVESFLADGSPKAFARVVDRLLASPHYGERWGRHWLDLARYADSNGMDENVAYANAFRYRDYVIRAFNADKPYDQFVKEQIAGDQLCRAGDDPLNHERLIATGFLVIGPKMLAEDDPVKMEMDIIDEQLDTVGRVFMGLTIGCARCHDHKFDPIPTADYYALAGIFKSTRSMKNHKVVAMWNERPLATGAQRAAFEVHQQEVARRNAEIKTRLDDAKAALTRKARAVSENPEADFPPRTVDELRRLRQSLAEFENKAPPIPEAMSVEEQAITNLRIHIRGNHLTLGEEVPRRFPRILAGADQKPIDATRSGRLEFANWLARPDHPLTARVMANRIWLGHFGDGLVRSPDNLGRLGDRPVHPELLDWLAHRFVESGWSVKALHRLIMLS
ncbi:MAG TPA: PSD1 and planctomycete cytochrome C domain-containing protein, partial [Isosphaeraceae bacterium]|nr:PSD1 and planctomycete cytochrome C domain-containing protein [Isosphaeraceae bacterium]